MRPRQASIPGAALLVLMVTTGLASATTIHVPGDYATIAEALANAWYESTVLVAPGTYQEHDLEVPPVVTLRGDGDSPADVVIDAAGEGRVLSVPGFLSRVEHLTLTGGVADQGGGVLLAGSGNPILQDVWIEGCQANLGGAIYVRNADALLERCVLDGNQAITAGGGVFAVDAPEVVLRGSLLVENTAGAYGGAWYAGRSGLAIESCDLVRNRADLAAEGGAFAGVGVTIDRSIAVDNAPTDGIDDLEDLVMSDVDNRLEHGCSLRWESGWLGYLAEQLADQERHNLDADPLFCETAGPPAVFFGLASSSPCAPGNNPSCGLIGAYDVACGGTATPDLPEVRCVLHPAYPNPFNPVTNVRYEIGRAGPVRLTVYALDGRRVATLVDEDRDAGAHTVSWAGLDDRGRSVASGVYLCRLQADDTSTSIRMTMVK